MVRARVDRLLAMGEALAAAELLTVLPPSPAGEELDDLRVASMLAADQVAPGCGIVDQVTEETAPWPAARLVCAALQGDDARVELLLSLMAEQARGATLLELLILLEGRPAAAAPLALRAALSGLRSLGLDADARAVAAAGLVG